jgi:hypothetical protein
MFRPVQNPDDEEAEGRVRTRTRTKELVITSTCQFFGCVCRVVVFSSFMSMCTPTCTICMPGTEAPHTPQSIHYLIVRPTNWPKCKKLFFGFIHFYSLYLFVCFFIFAFVHPSSRFPILLSYSLNCAVTIGVQNARNRPKQDSGNNSPEPEGNERRSHRKSPSSASNCSSSSSSVVHEKVSHPIFHASPSLLRFANRMNSQRFTNCLILRYQFLPYPFFFCFVFVCCSHQ